MIKVTYKAEYLAWLVIRYSGDYPGASYLTKDGWKTKEKDTMLSIDETMLWNDDDLQQLVSEVAKQGIKPKEASFTEGKLEATEKHLQDMRTLVLKEKA